jgi:hypothetical protein
MANFRTFFRRLFNRKKAAEDIICRKIGDSYFTYREVQGNYEQVDGPFTTCEQCKASSGATICEES